MPNTRRLRPVLRVGQRTSQTHEFRLVDTDGDPIDVSGADVTLSMEHDRYAYTAVEGGDATVVDGDIGLVEYEFSAAETSLHGRYRVQFEVDYGSSTELVPPEDDTWVLDVGRRIPQKQPLSAPSISADEGTFGDLQADTADIGQASVTEFLGSPSLDAPSIESLDVAELAGGIVGDRGPVTRLDGPDLYIDENGELAWQNPTGDGFAAGGDHDHSETGSGGDTLRPSIVGTVADPTDEVHTKRLNTSTVYVGDTGQYSTLSGAFADLAPTPDNRFCIELTSNITETESVVPKSHIDVNGNGFTVFSEYNGRAIQSEANWRDATWDNLTVDHRQASASQLIEVFWIGQNTAESVVFNNVTAIPYRADRRGHGFMIRHRARPTLNHCIAFAGGNAGAGYFLIHGSYPTLNNCIGYGGDSYGEVAMRITDASKPTINGCTLYSGTVSGARPLDVTEQAVPNISGTVCLPKKYSFFGQVYGTESESVTHKGEGETDDEPWDLDPVSFQLDSLTLNIFETESGATMDVGTTSGGTEIAADVDIGTAERISVDVNEVLLEPGEDIYFSPSTENISIGARWTMQSAEPHDGANLRSNSAFEVTGSYFDGGYRGDGANLPDTPTYQITNSTFKADQGFAIDAKTAPETTDPVYNSTVLGDTSDFKSADRIETGGEDTPFGAVLDGEASISGNSTTYHLNETHSDVWLVFDVTSVGGEDLALQLNGETTGAYVTRDDSGNTNYSQDYITLGEHSPNSPERILVHIPNGRGGNLYARNLAAAVSSHDPVGRCTDSGSPLTQFTILDTGGNSITGDVRVFGSDWS